MDRFYFVYQTTNLINNKIYIGVHETDDLHDGYLGSGSLLKQAIKKYGKENFKREIITFCTSKQAAYDFETQLVNTQFINRQDVYNITEGGLGVITHSPQGIERIKQCCINKVMAKDLLTHKIVKLSKAEFIANPHRYKGCTIGKKVMKTAQGNVITINNEYSNADLVGITKGLTKVINEHNQIIMVSVNDERFLSGQYRSESKGRIIVKDKTGNKFSVTANAPRLLSGELIGVAAGKRYKQNKKRKQIACPHCNQLGDISNMKRWHFDNCKHIIKI